MNPLKGHRVKHPSIKCDEFKPDLKPGKDQYRPKRLRWYKQEISQDYVLTVSDEDAKDGKYLLWAGSWTIAESPSLPKTGANERGQILSGEESLDQPSVDKIESVPSGTVLHGCDFAIFEESPISRTRYMAKGQQSNRQQDSAC